MDVDLAGGWSDVWRLIKCLTLSPVSLQLSGGCELVVVLLDFSSGAAGELSVRCGQTVELVERSADRPGWCLVRTTDQSPQLVRNQTSPRQKQILQLLISPVSLQEGLLPMSALCLSHSHSAADMEGLIPASTTSSSTSSTCTTTSSSCNSSTTTSSSNASSTVSKGRFISLQDATSWSNTELPPGLQINKNNFMVKRARAQKRLNFTI
ncbi:unnamed protein product [Pleuronectes platessa]|uniref:SH3 domain-containing protein n=1 Tax=Pleuronectes platessa TaxID=8262 RepID=A0A9N7U742_PLEPL|nr:unnamed protein product [Pleuronectes platessa]